MSRDNTKPFQIYIYASFVLLFAIRLLPYAFPSARMWGFNHLIFLPPIYTIIYIILGVLALALPFLPFSKKRGEAFINGFMYAFYDSPRKILYRLIFITVMLILFIVFSARTHFLGDGYSVLANITSESGTFIKWSEKGITFILLAIQSLLGAKSEATALLAFQIVSYISGVITIWFYFLIAGIISENRIVRLMAFMAMFFSGNLLLFFGYVENYPLAWVGLTGFVYFGLKYIKSNGHILWPVLFAFFAILIHLQMALILPALITLFFMRGRGQEIYHRYKILIWIIISILFLAGVVFFIKKYQTNLYIENIFLPIFESKASAPGYTLFGWSHVLDMINQLSLLSPLLLILILLSGRNWGIFHKKIDGIFLALIALGGLAFLFAIDPMLGLPRDWDLFSICGFGLTLLMVSLISIPTVEFVPKMVLSCLIYLSLMTLPFLAANLSTAPSLEYTKYFMELDFGKSYPAYSVLRDYHKKQEDMASLTQIDKQFYHRYINETKMNLANEAQKRGDFALMAGIAADIKPNRLLWQYHDLMSTVYYFRKDYQRSLEESNYAIQLNNYSKYLFANRSKLLLKFGRFDEAIESLNRAYKLDKHDLEILEGLIFLNLYRDSLQLSSRFAYEMLAIDSTASIAYYHLTKLHLVRGVISKAEYCFNKYLQYGRKDSLYERSRVELENLISNSKLQK
jgi:tetratricopeptide (TPR) repeat protein